MVHIALIALSVATALPGRAALPACEAYTDERELRFRVPARTVVGQILPESVVADVQPGVGVGQILVFGRATLAVTGGKERIAISFAYWQANDCVGWAPARGQEMTFDLADDKTTDGALRVMRAGVAAGAMR